MQWGSAVFFFFTSLSIIKHDKHDNLFEHFVSKSVNAGESATTNYHFVGSSCERGKVLMLPPASSIFIKRGLSRCSFRRLQKKNPWPVDQVTFQQSRLTRSLIHLFVPRSQCLHMTPVRLKANSLWFYGSGVLIKGRGKALHRAAVLLSPCVFN